jgi:hypothetical protein
MRGEPAALGADGGRRLVCARGLCVVLGGGALCCVQVGGDSDFCAGCVDRAVAELAGQRALHLLASVGLDLASNPRTVASPMPSLVRCLVGMHCPRVGGLAKGVCSRLL